MTEGTANLIDAAREAGAERIIVWGLAYVSQPGAADRPSRGLVPRFGHLYDPGSRLRG